MQHNNFEIRVLVKGRPINEYPHNGQVFVEGRAGSNFEIEFINRTPNRVEAILSVDGLSVIDGKEAGPNSAGYVVEPHNSTRIPGWKLTDEQVAAFVFSGKGDSYSAQSTGSSRNTGVIGALVFLQKQQYNSYFPITQHLYNHNVSHAKGILMNGGNMARSIGERTKSATRSVTLENTRVGPSGPAGHNGPQGPVGMNHIHATNAVFGVASASADSTYNPLSITEDYFFTCSADGRGSQVESLQTASVQNLGTGFGSATDFATTTTTFERGDLGAMLVLYYDDSRGLKARGIELQRPSRQRRSPLRAPQAFPGMNCVPPVGWKG